MAGLRWTGTGMAAHAAAEDVDRSAGGAPGQDDTLERLVGTVPAQPPTFVGREQAMAELGAAMSQALHGHGGLVLISGEPGIGKTRLMGELAALASRAGVTALWASCWEGGEAPVFWPWMQVLRAYVRDRDV